MARELSSAFQKKSRYVQGGLTDRHRDRLGWWERRDIPQATNDIITTILPSEQGRPWKIAFRVYSRDGLGWLVLQYNNIVDINEEVISGKKIRLPAVARVDLNIMTLPAGGNPLF